IELLHLLKLVTGGADGGLVPYGADRTLEFCRVHGRDFAVVVQIVKRLVNAGKLLAVGEDEQLVFAEAFCLIYRKLLRRHRCDAQKGEANQRKKSGEHASHI
ncbi:MAG TPA: hypothetical protein VIB39_14595, partial [Candidatus Angelobacter sp.]